jgi:uncharacterized protein (DUF885 family)
MGLGDDWKAALERTKSDYPEVGGQVMAVRDMAREAIAFVESRDLVTVPALAKEVWRMEMMSAEAQKTNPFFLGGEVIQVASPTDGQSELEKVMALRANNRHFSRATVHHELIPGHHLQGFAAQRNNSGYRSVFSTPFYTEGWALWWEIHLWNLNFPVTPENRMGMLFWRMHRAARIIFSMNFHLGVWSPQECIDFLVERVGHERDNATAEVRRSFQQAAPLYQAAYLLGGLQIHSLRKELVGTGRMSEKQFHDEMMRQGTMPIAWVRLAITKIPLKPDTSAAWKFYGEIPLKP